MRLKLAISEIQTHYFYDSRCSSETQIETQTRYSETQIETQTRYSERTDLDSLSSRSMSNSIGSYISSFSKSMDLKMRYM